MRSVLEHSEVGDRVGHPVAASDPDGDPLTYSLVGGTGTFTIDGTSGQILVNDAPWMRNQSQLHRDRGGQRPAGLQR